MPLFEYRCRDCGQQFEKLTRTGDTPNCPDCRGTNLEKLLSVFAVGSPRISKLPAGPPCGTCGDPRGPGSCAID
jgi:putative FmdB family regulatory protein